METVTAVADQPALPAAFLTDLGPSPNPFNPGTSLRFELTEPAPCRVRIHDLRGRLIWESRALSGQIGLNTVTWNGVDTAGRRAAGGIYVYRIEARGRAAATGKLTLAP